MPLKLIPPSAKRRTPNYTARGTHLGCYINRSLGTGEKVLAKKLIRELEKDIERGAITGKGAVGFAAAANAYMKAGGETKYLNPLIGHFKHTPLIDISQTAIDNAATEIYPHATPATLNRQVYTPVSAVLKRAGIERQIKRPIGWRGQRMTHWLTAEQAFSIFDAVPTIHAPEETKLYFRALLILYCYTGMRLSDALRLKTGNVDTVAKTALLYTTKNGAPRLVYLPDVVVEAIKTLPASSPDSRLFPFHKGGRFYKLFRLTCEAAGVVLPARVAFHVFCHTWATWMRQHGGLDTYDLLKTDRWADAASANRYAHVVVSDIAKRADLLPVDPKKKASAA